MYQFGGSPLLSMFLISTTTNMALLSLIDFIVRRLGILHIPVVPKRVAHRTHTRRASSGLHSAQMKRRYIDDVDTPGDLAPMPNDEAGERTATVATSSEPDEIENTSRITQANNKRGELQCWSIQQQCGLKTGESVATERDQVEDMVGNVGDRWHRKRVETLRRSKHGGEDTGKVARRPRQK
ncbi:hypothetical protein EDB89DRAFT_2248419 [Lactarius sanguifluus]|nr:hypothetical protein EDB89DRAFT_2248419 [Lactarius sanguifluus]